MGIIFLHPFFIIKYSFELNIVKIEGGGVGNSLLMCLNSTTIAYKTKISIKSNNQIIC